ncbi:MAG: hypothetical protein ACFFFG_11830 [Candidatus Thorarchaeota archaeon]
MLSMSPSSLLTAYLENNRQKQAGDSSTQFMQECLLVWDYIHEKAPELSVSDIKSFSRSIYKTLTLPLYEKFSALDFLEKQEGWVKEYASLTINWADRGRIIFPLRLITYEVVNHHKRIFEFFLQKLRTGEMEATAQNLFEFLFPKLLNIPIPLTNTDLLILKALQPLQDRTVDYLKGVPNEELADYSGKSFRNIVRRVESLRFCQIHVPIHFLDLAQLGYETFLLSHDSPIPAQLADYTLMSTDLMISTFSIVQIPIKNKKIFVEFQDRLQPTIFQPMADRALNWNLTGLRAGDDGWEVPPSFIYCDPTIDLTVPSPALGMSVLPELERFRSLTAADIKILEFLTTMGSFTTKKRLSDAVKVSTKEVTQRVTEYQSERLLQKVYQFYNIGLDLTVFFFIASPQDVGISWLNHFLTFPKMDVFSNTEPPTSFYFGHLKLPPKWYKDFTRKLKQIKQKFPTVKIYYSVEPPLMAKWNLSLKQTYVS